MGKKDSKQPPSMFDNMDLFDGVNFEKEATAVKRHGQIGGHKA